MTFYSKIMTLYDVHELLSHYDPKFPEFLALWLRDYLPLHQIAFASFILNRRQYAIPSGSPLSKKQHDNCQCSSAYFIDAAKYPLNMFEKCVPGDFFTNDFDGGMPSSAKISDGNFFVHDSTTVQLQQVDCNHIYLRGIRKVEPERYIYSENGKHITIYALREILMNPKCNINTLSKLLDCVEYATLLKLLTPSNIRLDTFQKLLPNHLKINKTQNVQSFTRNYESTFVKNMINLETDAANDINFIKESSKLSKFLPRAPIMININKFPFEDDDLLCQLNFVGNKFYLIKSEVMNSAIAIDDFGYKTNIPLKLPNFKDFFSIECIRITKGLDLYGSGYAKDGDYRIIITDIVKWGTISWFDTSFERRAKEIDKLIATIFADTKLFFPAATYNCTQKNLQFLHDQYKEEMRIHRRSRIHFNGLVFRKRGEVKNYVRQKRLLFNNSRYLIVRDDDKQNCEIKFGNEIVNIQGPAFVFPDTDALFSAYFLVEEVHGFGINLLIRSGGKLCVFLGLKSTSIIKLCTRYRSKKFTAMSVAKIGFNAFASTNQGTFKIVISEIQYIRAALTKNIRNVVSYEILTQAYSNTQKTSK
jgi:hypothetical protein